QAEREEYRLVPQGECTGWQIWVNGEFCQVHQGEILLGVELPLRNQLRMWNPENPDETPPDWQLIIQPSGASP
ncbi:MAG: hypothetical protein ACRCZF_13175, partial [Gemmataceae bacterium]